MHTCHCGKEFATYKALNAHQIAHSKKEKRYSVSRANPNPIVYNCRTCGKEFRHSWSTMNIYCSNKCQKAHETKELVRKWLEEGTFTNRHIPKWVKNELRVQRGDCCEVCKITEWNGKPLSLECDHIDGNPHNNHIDNLRLICPNCHSQTPSFKGKNKGNGRKNRHK